MGNDDRSLYRSEDDPKQIGFITVGISYPTVIKPPAGCTRICRGRPLARSQIRRQVRLEEDLNKNMSNDIKNLSQKRSLVMGNMPHTIVHTARQPIPGTMRNAIKAFFVEFEDENDIIEEDILTASARAFADAEDDRAAAAALGVLYSEARDRDDARCRRLVLEVDNFLKRGRSVYIKEIKVQTGDSRYDLILENSLFIERAIRSGNTLMAIIVKQLESLYTFTDDPLPPDNEEYEKRLDDSYRWFDLICKKLIDRCHDYLKDEKAGTKPPEEGTVTDRGHIEQILHTAETARSVFDTVIKKLKSHSYGEDVITWFDAINEEVKQ